MATGVKSRSGTVSKWGNSLGLRIPKEAVEMLQLKEGETVMVSFSSENLVVHKARARKKWTEAELLQGVTPEICGPDLLPDAVGKEIV